jgi:6-pyruvoyltetrahydropterin/6-carboxytetrahydropterin synthase
MDLRVLHTAAAGFEAARRLDALPAGHRAHGLHGHSFRAQLRCALPAGWAAFPGGEVARLREQLEARVARLDYRLLNEQLGDPSDEHLARWLHAQIDVPGVQQVSLRSAPTAGVDLDASGGAHLWRRHAFQSAHRLPNVPAGHKCGRMHGHGFEVILHAAAEGGGVDHDAIDAAWAPIARELDHACLNDLPGLDNPTSEMLSSWLWQRLKPALPALSWITVYETGSCGAMYDGERYRIWKELTLDSAVQLKRAPDGSALRRLHGHTFTLRLHLSAPLDAVMGWTVDFGDVKELFTPLFKALDHRPLHEMAELPDCDTASLASWVLQRARADLPQLDRVDLFETPGCGAIALAGGAAAALPV